MTEDDAFTKAVANGAFAGMHKPPYVRKEVIGDCTLILGDSMEVVPSLSADAAIYDPPYGVELGYSELTDDSAEIIQRLALPVLSMVLERVQRVALTPGVKNMMKYPEPTHVGSFYYPAGAGLNSWGFTCWQPIFFYGKDPYGGKGSRPDSFVSTEAAEKNGHPCPKPIQQMTNLVNRASVIGETVLDPFMGSGTTGVACAKLGRKFVGIEIDPTYFEIALRRIEAAHKQTDMFVQIPQPKIKQETFI